MLYEIAQGTAIDLKCIDVVETTDGGCIVRVDGMGYLSDISYRNMIEMVNMAKSKPQQTTNPSQYAG